MKLTRGEFLKLFALFVGTGGALAACSDDGSSSPGPGDGNTNDGSSPPGSGSGDGSVPGSTDAGNGAQDSGNGAQDSGNGAHDSGSGNGKDSGSNNTPPSCTDKGAKGTVGFSGGHSHGFANVPAAHFAAPIAERTYLLTDSGGHTHTLTLSAAEMTMLASGQSVTKASSVDAAHAHDVVLTCL